MSTPCLGRGLEDVERAVHQHLERQARLLGALGDADRGLVEDQVDALGQVGDEVAVADVALDQVTSPVLDAPARFSLRPAHQVVEHDDLRDGLVDELVDDRGADRARRRR